MRIEVDAGHARRVEEIAGLVRATFTASEGRAEGDLIGALARRLMQDTAPRDLRAFVARDGQALVGAILFSRLTWAGDPRSVFVLGPVAVATLRQGQGIGRQMIAEGLAALKAEGVDIALTYGDPAYYTRAGFAPIREDEVPAPFPLQHPHGWLGQSLSGAPVGPFRGRPRCVAAFGDPAFW